MSLFKIPKARSVVSVLREKFGGSWKYDGHGTWQCDDDKRFAARRCNCFPDDGDCKCFPTIWVYGDGTPERLL